ncbi:MAG: DNA adenine methylase, partial [Armatimonadota bacterium]
MNYLEQESYITDQLIPYLGNKRKLLPLIKKAITATGVKSGSFIDLFAGSTVVSRMAKSLGYRVISNDWEPYSYYTSIAYIKSNDSPLFRELGDLEHAIDLLNNMTPVKG